jgi:hypothetical protein
MLLMKRNENIIMMHFKCCRLKKSVAHTQKRWSYFILFISISSFNTIASKHMHMYKVFLCLVVNSHSFLDFHITREEQLEKNESINYANAIEIICPKILGKYTFYGGLSVLNYSMFFLVKQNTPISQFRYNQRC